jgi:hypothetical protein
MTAVEARRRLEEAEARCAWAWRHLMYLRDSELYDYEIEDQYRIALREYRMAEEEVRKARSAAEAPLPELVAA